MSMTESPIEHSKWFGKGAVRMRIREFSPVAIVMYKDDNDTQECVICRSELMGPSPNRRESSDFTDEKVAKGQCGHIVHYECIAELSRKKTSCPCPVCGLPWLYDQSGMVHNTVASFLTRNKTTKTMTLSN